jgi:2-polyprenyl-3-methyl-5-hydroxy-6-metoxy-1,4-benzoquinol methylase
MQTIQSTQDRTRDMDERSWWDLWNKSYRAEDNKDETSTELFAHVVATIKHMAQGRPKRILEVACGTGTLSRRLDFSSYHGLDISPGAVEIAGQKADLLQLPAGTNRPTYEASDFHEWPSPAGAFDIVLCVDAISCFRDQQLVLRKMAEILPVGGLVVLTTVNPVVYNRIRRVGGVRLENGPVSHWLSKRELHDLIEKTGLTLERSYTIMPRGNMGFLRVLNSGRLNQMLGTRGSAIFRWVKELAGLGQYRVVVARKGSPEATKRFRSVMRDDA